MATKNTEGRKTIIINEKEVTFCFNHNSQITKALDANGNPIEDDAADPWTKVLRDMPRYNDGTAYSKPQPRVKIGNEVIKLGNRYMTPAEKEEVKGYTGTHSTKGSGTTTKAALFTERVATLKSLKECIAEIGDEKVAAPIVKRYDALKAQLLEDLDPTTKALIDAGIIVF